MKTAEELAKEHLNGIDIAFNLSQIDGKVHYDLEQLKEISMSDFIAGYNKAKEWISVDDQLPEVLEFDYKILVKDKNNYYELYTIYADDFENQLRKDITHWRYID